MRGILKRGYMEDLDIVDENGNPTGQVEARDIVHEKGLQYRSSHVWVMRKKEGKTQVLLQKRSPHKSSYPSCYDISSAGHVPAGMGYLENAVKELGEELGIQVETDKLIGCGLHRMFADSEFHGKRFLDRQVAMVYLLWYDVEEDDLLLQKEEVESVKWFDFDECLDIVKNNTILNCLDMRELEIIGKGIR